MPDKSEILDRLPPNAPEAEQSVIGSMLLDQACCDDIAEHVSADDFYADANRKLFAAITAKHNDGGRVDALIVAEALKSAGDFEVIGGAAYLAEVMQAVPVASHAVYYAKIVKAKSIVRLLIHGATDTLRDAYSPLSDIDELVTEAEERIFAIRDRRSVGEVATIQDVLVKVFAEIDAISEGTVGGLSTGFVDLDEMIGGLHPGELSILAARPSMGKTAMALNIADNVSTSSNATVLFVSLEMTQLELSMRLLCSRAKVNGWKLKRGFLNDDERQRLVKASSELASTGMQIDDSPGRTVGQIASAGRRIARRQCLDLIVVDYLQLLTADNPRDPRQEQVAKMARRLKGVARELGIPVLCLAQLNRQVEATGDNRPKLSHLRESGAIEQDADVVMFIHRPEYYLMKDSAEKANVIGKAEVIVAKQRNGPTGDIALTWLEKYTRFENTLVLADSGTF